MILRHPRSTLFPYATLFRSVGELLAVLPLEPLEPRVHPVQLVLEAEHVLDAGEVQPELVRQALDQPQPLDVTLGVEPRVPRRDRKSTRLNSSHANISYAVFC